MKRLNTIPEIRSVKNCKLIAIRYEKKHIRYIDNNQKIVKNITLSNNKPYTSRFQTTGANYAYELNPNLNWDWYIEPQNLILDI